MAYSTKSKQVWAVGNYVKCGFHTYLITGGNTACWQLVSTKGIDYEFEPYRGLYRVY